MDLNVIIEWILHPIRSYKDHKEYKERIEELKKKDPFIYK